MKKNLKICGNTNFEDVQKMYDLGVRTFGFVTNFPKSPRSNSFSKLNNLNSKIKTNLKHVFLVSVMVNPGLDDLGRLEFKNLDALQLHGQEDYKKIQKIREDIPKNIQIWKTFTLEEGFDKNILESKIEKLSKIVDLFLFDVQKTADFKSAKHVFWETKFIYRLLKKNLKIGIAGGIKPNNVQTFSKYFNSCLIDISSGVELEPGKKDIQKVQSILNCFEKN